MTQRMASTRLDLPQPFGPTTPVRPGSILNSVGSQKLLNPASRSRSNFIAALQSSPSTPHARLRESQGPTVHKRAGRSSAFRIFPGKRCAPLALWSAWTAQGRRMRSTKIIHVVSSHAEGEVGDVIVGGVSPPPGATLWEQSRFIARTRRCATLC